MLARCKPGCVPSRQTATAEYDVGFGSQHESNPVIRLQFSVELSYDIAPPGCDFIFSIHAALTPQQTVVSELLSISQHLQPNLYTDPATLTRLLRLQAFGGPLTVRYAATVDLHHAIAEPHQLAEVPVADLPGAVLPYLYPSRYCPSDRLHRLAVKEFGQLSQGYARVQAIRDWVASRVAFTSGSSDSNTTAVDTLVDGVGVCRDFAHLMIALCRAVNLPARFATGIDYGADPALGPPDFHAYVEVYLSGGWYLFDPSGTAIPMGFVRFCTGRDAADCAFATMFGAVTGAAPVIHIEAVANALGAVRVPHHVEHALSTDGQWR